jgi:glycosyltransferase involved in cell wall biosynthesis
MSAALPLFSIIICTYNRVHNLRTALDSAVRQEFDAHDYEIIVVDGNSTDGTRDFVLGCLEAHENLSYVNEEKPGLSFARNRGWQISKGKYTAFIDDDCKAPHDWLSRAAEIVERFSPDAFGGPFYASYNGKKPAWWKDAYGSRKPLQEARMLKDGEYLFGGNLFLRTSLLGALGGFSPAFGPVGRKLGVGDETELLVRLRASGRPPSIYYDPDLFAYHLVHPDRMTLRWAFFFNLRAGKYYRAYREAVPEKTPGRSIRLVLKIVRETGVMVVRAGGVIFRDRGRYPFWQNYFYEVVAPRAYRLGRAVEQLTEPAIRIPG